MADGANLDLTISSGLDASVHKSFAAITKLLKSMDKTLGSLNSSMAQIAKASLPLSDSIDSITVAAVKAADKVDKLGDSFVEAAEKQQAASKQMKKTSLEQADIHRVTSKQYMTNIRLADQYSQRLAHIDSTVKKTSKEYGLQVSALTKTERAYQNLIKSSDMAVERVAKMEKELAALREERSKFATNSNEALTLDPQIKRLEARIERIRVLTTEEGHKALVEAFDYDRVFQQNLKKIKKSQIFTETEKHIQKLSEFGDYAVDIYNRLTKSMSDSSAERKIVEKEVTKYATTLTKELLQLDNDIRSASYSRLHSIGDKDTWNKYNERVEMLKAQRAELWDSATNPHTSFETYNNRKATVVNEAIAVSKYAQSVHELRKEYGQWAVDIFEDVTVGIDESSRRFKRELDNVKRYGNQYHDELSRIDSEIKAIQHDLGSSTLSDDKRDDLDKRLLDSVSAKARLMDTITGSNAVSEYHAKRAGLGNDVIPLSKLEQYTKKLSKYGEVAESLFNYLNIGLDENSEQIKRNYEAVEKYFNYVNKKRDELQAQRTDKLASREAAVTDEEIALADKGLDALDKRIAKWDDKISADGILEGFFGHKSGRDAAFSSLYELMGELPTFKKRLDEIKDSTVHGSVDQRQAITKLKKDFDEYNDVLRVTDTLTAVSVANLDELKRNNAAEDAIKKHQTVVRELEGIRKNLTNTFSGVSDFGASTNLSNLMKRYSGILTSTTPFGDKARGLFANIDVSKLDELDTRLGNIKQQYSNVIPTIAKFAEVNGLSAEQVAKLNSAEFIQQASLQKTKEGVRKLAEEYLGFHKTSRVSLTLFDRMAASMGNMARYAFGASIYYAFENAIFSTIDAVAQFDQSLKNLQAITDATDKEVELLGEEIKRVAVETKYGLKDVAEGATIIGQAGFSATETMSILGSTMKLAQGSMSTVAASADLLTTAIAAFNLNASDAAMVADNMAAAMNYSKLDIDKLRTTFNYVGPVAMDAGASLQEMSAVLMVLANNGMKASTIGTSLRNVFSQLQSPSAALRKAFKGNETELAKLADKSVPVVDKFRILNKQLGTSANLFKMFGLRAAGTVSILMKFPEQIQEMYDGLHTLGEAERMADKQMEGLANRMANFRASLEVFGVTITEKPSEGLSSFVGWATKAVHWLTELVDGPVGSAIATFAGFAGAIGATVVAGRLFAFMFNTTVTGAISAFGKASVWVVEKLMVLAAAMGSTTAASSGLVGTLAVFSKSNPVIAGLTAIATTIAVIAGAYSLFSKEENIAYKQLQKELKERREQIGLLRTALKYNRELSDSGDSDTTRSRNNIYIASNFPEISSAIMATENREDAETVLRDYLRKLEDDTIRLTRESMDNTARRIQQLKDERKRAVDWYNRGNEMIDATIIPFTGEDLEDLVDTAMGSVYRGDEFDKLYVPLSDSLKTATVEFSNTFDYWVETAKSRTSEIVDTTKGIFDGLDEAGKANKLVSIFAESLDNIIRDGNAFEEAGDKIVKTLRTIAVASFELQHNVSVSGNSIDSLSSAMTELGLNGKAITKIYNDLGDKHLVRLFRRFKTFSTEYNDIIKKGLNPEEQGKQLAALRDKFNAGAINDIATVAKNEISWIEAIRKKEVESIEASTLNKELAAERVREINMEYYAQIADEYYKLIENQLAAIEKLAGKEIDPLTINYLINAQWGKIDPALKSFIVDNPELRGALQGYWGASSNHTSAAWPKPAPRPYGAVSKNNFDLSKNLIDKERMESEIAYESGKISYKQYMDSITASDNKLLQARRKYVSDLIKEQGYKDHTDKVDKESAANLEMEQKQRLEAIKRRRDVEKQAIELTRDESLASIAEVDSELRRSDMNAMDRDEQLLANEETRIRVTLASMREEYALGGKQEEQERKLLEIKEKELELAENIKEQERLAYANRTKYIEQEYKYGLQTQSAYRENIRKQMAEGTVNPYDAQKDLWLDSNDPFDGYKHGIASIAESTKTMNEYISEGVQNFRDEWHSAMDEFVDSWWDGTKSAEEIFGDFVNNLARDWTKKLLQMYSDEMFAGFAKSFLGGNNGWLSDNYMNYGGGRTPSIGIATPAITEAATPKPASSINVDTTGLQLSLNSTLQNIQTNLGATSTSVANDVSTMADESTQLLTGMADGASNLWSFLANGFNGLWGNISSGISGILSTIAFATTSSFGGSFWERWLGNSIGMGFKLVGSFSGGAQQSRVDANYQGMQAIGESGYNDLYDKMFPSAKGNVFKGLSDFSNSIVSSPTLFTYGEHLKAFAKGGVMGEAGPEAIMPLTRDGAGRLGVSAEGAIQPCINNIYIETPAGYTAEQKSRVANDNGGEDIMFTIVKQTAKNVTTPGSPMFNAMKNTFGASQVLTSR